MMPKQFKPVQFETLDHVREQIRIKIDGCLDSIVEILVEIHPVCEKAYKAPLEELPLLMGQSESSDEIIKHRLSGKDNNFEINFDPFHEVMADHGFSVDEYKWIGEIDGQRRRPYERCCIEYCPQLLLGLQWARADAQSQKFEIINV